MSEKERKIEKKLERKRRKCQENIYDQTYFIKGCMQKKRNNG